MVADSTPELPAFLQQLVRTALHDEHTFHQFETALWKRLLQAGHDAVDEFLRQLGSGDLGPETTLADEGRTVRRLEQGHPRELTCLFGRFTLQRTCYGTREGQAIALVPLDTRLDLPRGTASYALQDLNTMLSACEPFGRVGGFVEKVARAEAIGGQPGTPDASRVRTRGGVSRVASRAAGVGGRVAVRDRHRRQGRAHAWRRGACRHYVKDRMEGTGMSWSQNGARAMLRLRCVLLNGEWEAYQDHFHDEERKSLYPHRGCLETLKWPVAA